MTPLSPQRFVRRLGACLAVLAVLLLISPGVGTESADCGWWDAWRAKLGWEITADELVGLPLADLDDDGSVSELEQAAYVATARA
ncbi:MAG: hypothetical protein ACE5EX_11290, partial [Phycisphaerae bacterium]